MSDSSTYIEIEGVGVVDEETGELLESSPDSRPIEQLTRLALEAAEQRKEWEKQEKLYKLMLRRLDVKDETTPAGRAVLRGGFDKHSSTREMFDASFFVQDLPYDTQAAIVRECFNSLDPKRLLAFARSSHPAANAASSALTDLISTKPVGYWVEVKPIKKQATELTRRAS